MLLFHKMGEHFMGTSVCGPSTRAATAGSPRCSPGPPEAFGAEVRLDSPVSQVLTEGGRTTGVVLAYGTEIRGPDGRLRARPAADLHRARRPPRPARPTWSTPSVERMRFRGVSAKVNFALDDLPVFPALPDTVDHYGGFLNIGPTMEYVERAFDAAKYGWYSEKRPFIDAAIQSVVDPDMAHPGKHVMSCFVQYAPYELRGSDGSAERDRFGDKAQAVLEEHFPGFGDLVLHREVVTPKDIEEKHRADGGQHLRRGVPRAADVLLPPGARGGASTPPPSTATTSAVPGPTRVAASSAPPASSPHNGCCAT